MQEGLIRNWQKKKYAKGVFGGYTVVGFWYENLTGETGWHITAWPMRDPIHDYWVSKKIFYSVRIHYMYQGTNRTLIEIFDPMTVDKEEREAILAAIAKWEAPDEPTK